MMHPEKKQSTSSVLAVAIFAVMCFPQVALAQFVPVIDVTLIGVVTAINTLQTAFRSDSNSHFTILEGMIGTNPDSLRNIMGGANPPTAQLWMGDTTAPGRGEPENGTFANPLASGRESCFRRQVIDMNSVASWANFGVTPSMWQNASDATAALPPAWRIPSDYRGAPQGPILVNGSVSLSCLLQELVEWKKLDLNLQIHNMLREYIANAQSRQLAQELAGNIAKANIAWSRQANQDCRVDPTSGAITCTQTSTTNSQPGEFANSRAEARRTTLVQQVAGNATTPAGTTNSCSAFKVGLAQNVARDTSLQTTDKFETFTDQLKCTRVNTLSPADAPFTSEGQAQQFIDGDCSASPYGCALGFMMTMADESNAPATAATEARLLASAQIAEVKQATRDQNVGVGGNPVYACSGRADDPNCDPYYASIVTSKDVVRKLVSEDAAGLGNQQIQSVEATKQNPATDALERQATQIVQGAGGMESYDVTNLGEDPRVENLVQEFYSAIGWGYIDAQYDTRRWAQATMLSIYDMMPQTDLTTSPGNLSVPQGNSNVFYFP